MNLPSQLITDISLQLISALALTKPIAFHRITGDGNCFFRCISYAITGIEDYHRQIRQKTCYYMETNETDVEEFLPVDYNSTADYLSKTDMKSDNAWTSEFEIFCTAISLKTNIYLYGKHGVHWTWIKYSSAQNIDNKSIYLFHKNENHFEIVLGVENSCTPNDFDSDPNSYTTQQQSKNLKRSAYYKTMYSSNPNFRENKKMKFSERYKTDTKYATNRKYNLKQKYKSNQQFRIHQRLTKKKYIKRHITTQILYLEN